MMITVFQHNYSWFGSVVAVSYMIVYINSSRLRVGDLVIAFQRHLKSLSPTHSGLNAVKRAVGGTFRNVRRRLFAARYSTAARVTDTEHSSRMHLLTKRWSFSTSRMLSSAANLQQNVNRTGTRFLSLLTPRSSRITFQQLSSSVSGNGTT